jgi:hypothetical protein
LSDIDASLSSVDPGYGGRFRLPKYGAQKVPESVVEPPPSATNATLNDPVTSLDETLVNVTLPLDANMLSVPSGK